MTTPHASVRRTPARIGFVRPAGADVVPIRARGIDGVTIPPRSLDWRRHRLEVETAAKRQPAGLNVSSDGSFGSNTRLHWTFNPRSEVSLTYNHNLRESEDRWRRDANELLVKGASFSLGLPLRVAAGS